MRPLLCAALVLVLVAACAPPGESPSALHGSPAQPTATVAIPTPRATAQPPGTTPGPVRTAPPLRAQHAAVPLSLAQLNALIDPLLPEPADPYGIVVEDVASGARVARNDTRVFPSASLYKLGVAWAVLRAVDAGAVGMDTPIEILDDDAVEVEPDGGVAPGDTPTVADALGAMISISSNAAAHAFMRVLGRQTIDQELQRIGLSHTRIPEATEDAGQRPGTVVTTAADVARLLRLVATSNELSARSRSALVQWLANAAPPDALRDNLPPGIDLFDKTGNLDDASNVAALVQSPRGTLLLAVVDQGVDPGDARAVIAKLGEFAFATLRP